MNKFIINAEVAQLVRASASELRVGGSDTSFGSEPLLPDNRGSVPRQTPF